MDCCQLGVAVLIPCEPVSGLARLHGFPELVVQNTQFRYVLDHPLFLGVRSCLAFARVRIFHEALTVPDDFADIHLIVEDTVPALWVAVDRAETLIATGWGGDAILVEREGDRLGRLARGIVAEDAADDLGLSLVDGSVEVVPLGETVRRLG